MSEVILQVGPAQVGRKVRMVPHNLNHRLHWRARHAWNKAWKELVWASVLSSRQKFQWPLPMEKAAVIVRFNHCHRLDIDNAFTCCKPLIDGLRYAGVIKDDDELHMTLEVERNKVNKLTEQGVEIRIKQM